MPIRGVFFDLGGTLLVMRRYRVFRKALLELGIEASLEQLHSAYLGVESWWLSVYGNRRLSSEQTDEAYRDLDAKVYLAVFPGANAEEADRVSKLVRSRWPEVEKSVPLEMYPDAEPLLQRLKSRGYSMALVSNAPADTSKVVEALGLERYLDPIVISGVVGFSKPHPEIFRIAMKGAGVRPDETVHIGDLYESDVVGARNSGIQAILLDRDGSQVGADCPRISSLAEAEGFLR
jgi:HAD superfamily hydrolase (TIGR01549 family)